MRGKRARELRRRAKDLWGTGRGDGRTYEPGLQIFKFGKRIKEQIMGKKTERMWEYCISTGQRKFREGTFRRIYRDLKKGYVNG